MTCVLDFKNTKETNTGGGRTPQILTLWWAGHRRSWLCGGQDTADPADSAVDRAPQSQTGKHVRPLLKF